jgi:Fe-S-cluster formation regulator IscX/YfhJ
MDDWMQDPEIEAMLSNIQALFDQRLRLVDFAEWLISLDDDDPNSAGRKDRQTITLTKIIERAKEALGE